MNKAYQKASLMFLLILGSVDNVFSRAGGGGHSSSGAGGGSFGHYGSFHRGRIVWDKYDNYRLILIIVIIFIVALLSWKAYQWIIRYKAGKIDKLMANSQVIDNMWNKEKLESFIRDVFMRMQDAWMNQDMGMVDDIISKDLYNKYQFMLNAQKRKGIYNYIGEIQIDKIRIVGFEDYTNNGQDNFTAYISGKMVDFLIKKDSNIMTTKDSEPFEDLYYFGRLDNEWLLCGIKNEIDIWDVAELRTVSEY